MYTNIHRIWESAKQPIIVGLAALVVGSVLGVLFPPSEQRHYCPAPMLRAHFLERHIAFNLAGSSSSSSAIALQEPVRPAAPEEPVAVEPTSSSIASSEASSEASSDTSSVSSAESASSSSTASVAPIDNTFPAFGHAVYPVTRIPDWGAMRSASEWNRSYEDMDRASFVRLPRYDIRDLTIPVADLKATRDEPNTIKLLTAKLFYSTRFFGTYDIDGGEFEGSHAGIDLKLPEGMPVVSIAGGRVNAVHADADGLGLHVIVEHRIGNDAYYSIYGHLSRVSVAEGDAVAPGDTIGRVGSTGKSTLPHLHLQIDRGTAGETPHEVYWPGTLPSRNEAASRTVHPMSFIATHGL